MPDEPVTPALNTQDLSDEALRQSLATYNNAQYQLTVAQSAYDQIKNDPAGDVLKLQAASQQADNARAQLGQAARAHSALLGKFALAYTEQQRFAKDPDEKNLWAKEAEKASAQTDLYKEEAS